MSVHTEQWENNSDKVSKALKSVIGDALIIAASVCYGSVLDEGEEQKFLDDCRNALLTVSSEHDIAISISENVSLFDLLSTNAEQDQWFKQHSDWLDEITIKNILRMRAASNFGSNCWPLLIDPLGKAEKCIELCQQMPLDIRKYSSFVVLAISDMFTNQI